MQKDEQGNTVMNVMQMRFESKKPNDFAERFNKVGEAFDAIDEEGISEEEKNRRIDAYFSMKCCLEQGLPF